MFVLFKDKKKPVELQVKKLNTNQIKITGCKINTSGFAIFKDEAMKHKLGNYENFTTLYQELEDESFILSNDGSVYPQLPETESKPSLREMVENLNVSVEKATNASESIAEEVTNLQIAVAEIYEMLLMLTE